MQPLYKALDTEGRLFFPLPYFGFRTSAFSTCPIITSISRSMHAHNLHLAPNHRLTRNTHAQNMPRSNQESCERALTKQKPRQNSCGCEPMPRRGVQRCGILGDIPRLEGVCSGVVFLGTSHRSVRRAVSGYICDRNCERAQRVTFATATRSLTSRLLIDDGIPL